jgi:hypothetical protein
VTGNASRSGAIILINKGGRWGVDKDVRDIHGSSRVPMSAGDNPVIDEHLALSTLGPLLEFRALFASLLRGGILGATGTHASRHCWTWVIVAYNIFNSLK